jgi:hypothetical protein
MSEKIKRYHVIMTYVVCIDAADEKSAKNAADDFVTSGCDGGAELMDCGAEVEEVERP